MTNDLLLASTYFLQLDLKQAQKNRPYPPLATLYVAANLRSRGHRVELFDAMLASGEAAFVAQLDRVKPKIVVLYDDNFNFLSKMCLSRMRLAALTMIRESVQRGAIVIVSGPDVTDHPEPYLAAGAHYGVAGEGDHTVAELVDWLAAGNNPRQWPLHIPGLVMADAAQPVLHHSGPTPVMLSGPRQKERRPDVFAFPARDLLDIEVYRERWRAAHGYFSLNMVSTRGCPFHCNWCAKPIWGQRYAMRTPADVAEELALVKRTIAPDRIWFADDIFGLRASWLASFAQEVVARDAVIPFTMQSRCDLMTHEAVQGLHRAGCYEVWLGAESGSQKILDAMDKGITIAEIRRARALLGDAGIRAGFFIQFGYPGENLADIRATIELVRDTLPDDIGISVSYPLPGTRFHDMVAAQLGDKVNWEDSGDLEMMFQGSYTTAFYRHLHTALHDDFDLHRRKAGLSPTPHLSLPALSGDAQEERVARAWAEFDCLEGISRQIHPTSLVRPDVSPCAPDLTLPFN